MRSIDADRVAEQWLGVPVEVEFREPSPTDLPRDEDRLEIDGEWTYITHGGIGTYSVRDGEEVVVRPDGDATTDEVLAMLRDGVLGTILHDRGYHVLHAVAVAVDGEAVLLVGDSDAGKSTLAARFAMQGYALLADDDTAVSVDETAVRPVAPLVKLDREWAGRLGVDLPDVAGPLLADKVVYSAGDRREGRVPIGGIYVLEEGAEVEVEAVASPAAIDAVVGNTYTHALFDRRNEDERHFRACTAIAGDAPVRRLVRPRTIDALPDVIDAVVGDVTDR